MGVFKRILVAVDGSENSMEACSAAARICGESGTAIEVIHVASEDETVRGREETKDMLEKARVLTSQTLARVRTGVVEARGSVVDAIVRRGSDKKCDLIVLGAKGSGGFRRLLLGSVSSGVVTHAGSSVLVVRGLPSTAGRLFDRVLVAVDGSKEAARAVQAAAEVTKSTGAEFTILHVIYVPAAAYSSGSSAATRTERAARREAEDYLSAARDLAKKAGVDCSVRIVEDLQSPVRGIIEFASKEHSDLIVLGTRGRGGFRRLLLGSVASGVVNFAPCSVLVVREGGEG